jgi:hypothetical protein
LWFQHKWTWSVSLALFGIAKVNQKEGDTLADAITIAGTTLAITSIWIPEIRATMVGAAMATTVAAPVAAVVVSTYAIGGIIAFVAADPEDEGWYGAEALKEYYHDPVTVVADIATETIVDPLADWTQEQIIDPVAFWGLRRAQELGQLKGILERELFKNRWYTGPNLPHVPW